MAEAGRTIIVKRVKKAAHRHHGGAWKIAYADFVTAMMAFFLLMWLAGTISSSNLKGIEEYFKTPLKVALTGGPAVGNSKSVLKGGGKDLLEEVGQTRKTDIQRTVKKTDLKSAQEQVEKAEQKQLEALKQKLEAAIDASATLSQFKKQLLIDITSEGLRIQIVDEQNRPMFESSRGELQPYAQQNLREVEADLAQTAYLLEEAIEKLLEGFMRIHGAVGEQQRAVDAVLADLEPAPHLAQIEASRAAIAHEIDAVVTALQFQDLTGQLITRAKKRVHGLHEVLATLAQHGDDESPAAAGRLLQRIGERLKLQSSALQDGLKSAVGQKHMDSGEIELF